MPDAQKMSSSASPNNPNSPPDDFFPKLVHVFSANTLPSMGSSSFSRTTMPGHWSLAKGIIRYASATSLQVPSDPGGNDHTSVAVVVNVPQVHGYRSVLIDALIE